MKSYLLFILIVTMFFVVTKSEDEEYYTTEQPNNQEEVITTTTENALLRKGPEEYGKREELDPNLTGLENFALLYLPKNYNYSNIIEAYREVKDGIRYEILVNATDEKNIIIYCNLTIYEKSWFVTPWGERLRILEKSNCSSQTEIKDFNENFSIDQAHIDLTYENNTIFNPENKKISKGTSLDDIEGMIIEKKIQKPTQNLVQNSKSNNENNYETTTINGIVETTLSQIIDVDNNAADLSVRNDNNNAAEVQGNLNIANQDSSQHLNAEYTTEAPIIPTNLHQPGNREKLKTNLVGLENMALVYLPRQLTYTKIIEAYREVINGVRYDILIQANRNDHTEIICDIQVQEKPWLLTPWGDKVRVLEKSNCSDINEITNINDRNHLDQATLDEKYPNNTLFNPTVQHVSDDLLDKIESMIFQPKSFKKQSRTDNNNNNLNNNNLNNNNINNNNNNREINRNNNNNDNNENRNVHNTNHNQNFNFRHTNNDKNYNNNNYNTNDNNNNNDNENDHINGNNHGNNNDYNINRRNNYEFRNNFHSPITTSAEIPAIE